MELSSEGTPPVNRLKLKFTISTDCEALRKSPAMVPFISFPCRYRSVSCGNLSNEGNDPNSLGPDLS